MIYQFNGDQNTPLNFPELTGKTVISVRFSRWRDELGNDLGGRIDVEVDDSPAPILYVSDLFMSTPKINDDPEKALDEAIAEAEKGQGEPKSIAKISLSFARYLKHLEEWKKKADKKLEKIK